MPTTALQLIVRKARMAPPTGLPEGYWELIEGYRQELISQALAILGNREDAEDTVQETYCEAFRKENNLPQRGSVGAWLRSINRANAVDRLRARHSDSRKTSARQQQIAEEAFTTGGFSRLELRESFEKAIAALPEPSRAAVRLRFFEHLSYKEIAERLQIPVGTISGLLLDAFAALFARLNKSFPTAERPQNTESETREVPPVEGENP